MTSIEAGYMEMQTALTAQRFIAEVKTQYDNENLEAWLRGNVGAYAAALAEIVGPKKAFEIFSRLADTEMALQYPDKT